MQEGDTSGLQQDQPKDEVDNLINDLMWLPIVELERSWAEAEFQSKIFCVLLGWLSFNILLIRIAWNRYGSRLYDSFVRGKEIWVYTTTNMTYDMWHWQSHTHVVILTYIRIYCTDVLIAVYYKLCIVICNHSIIHLAIFMLRSFGSGKVLYIFTSSQLVNTTSRTRVRSWPFINNTIFIDFDFLLVK